MSKRNRLDSDDEALDDFNSEFTTTVRPSREKKVPPQLKDCVPTSSKEEESLQKCTQVHFKYLTNYCY